MINTTVNLNSLKETISAQKEESRTSDDLVQQI